MTDLDQAIATAREALARVEHERRGTDDDAYFVACAKAAEKLDDLLAALDAARGEAVAVVNRHMLETLVPNRWIPVVAPSEERSDTDVLLFAAPPAAAVPAGKDWQAEAMKHAQSALYWRERCEMLEDPVRKAQQPAAAVPEAMTMEQAWMRGFSLEKRSGWNAYREALLAQRAQVVAERKGGSNG